MDFTERNPERMRRWGRLGGDVLCWSLMVIIPCLVFAYWWLADRNSLLGGGLPTGVVLDEPTTIQRLICFGIICLPLLGALYGLERIWRIVGSPGNLLSFGQKADRLASVGKAIRFFGWTKIAANTAAVLVLTIHYPVGHRELAFSVGPSEALALVLGYLLIHLVPLLGQAQCADDELAQFV